MLSKYAITVENLSKCYQIYDKPIDRLKQFIIPKLNLALRRKSNNSYREFWALKDVSFKIIKGETVGIIGRNGSGKSTLLQLICGTLNPTSGRFISEGRIAALLELGSGFNPEFTGRENVYLNASILGISVDKMKEKINSVIEFSGLGNYIDQPLKTYSSGMQARLAFSTSIHVEPDILVIDEALAVGDSGFQLKCMLQMKKMQDEGVTIIFVSHDTGSVIRLCNRVFVLDQGRIVSQETDPLACVKLYEELSRTVVIPELQYSQQIKENSSQYSYELQGIQETRFGSHEAQYTKIEFQGLDKISKQVYTAGEEIIISATVESSRHFSKIVAGFTLKNKSGVDVWGDNNLYANKELSLEVGKSLLSFRFKLNLPAGEYFLYIGLADISINRTELDQRWPVRRITIVSERQALGYSFSPAEINLIRLAND